MSAFDFIPDPFPLEVKVEKRPISVIMKADTSDAVVAIILLCMWCAGAMFVAWLFLDPFSIIRHFSILALLGIIAIVASLVFFLPKIKREIDLLQTRVLVKLDEDTVSVTHEGGNAKKFSCPISDYKGLIKESYGSQLVAGEKIQVVALVMKHENEERSLPLIITEAKRLGRRRIERYGEALGLEVLPYDHSARLGTNMLEGVIYANEYQAKKVGIVMKVLGVVGLAIIGLSIAGFIYWGTPQLNGQPMLGLGMRLLASAGVALTGAGIIWGVAVYLDRYVVSMGTKDGELFIVTVRSKHLKFKTDDVNTLSHNAGKTFTGRQTISTPYAWLTLKNSKQKFLIDWQAEYIDERALKDLVS